MDATSAPRTGKGRLRALRRKAYGTRYVTKRPEWAPSFSVATYKHEGTAVHLASTVLPGI